MISASWCGQEQREIRSETKLLDSPCPDFPQIQVAGTNIDGYTLRDLFFFFFFFPFFFCSLPQATSHR